MLIGKYLNQECYCKGVVAVHVTKEDRIGFDESSRVTLVNFLLINDIKVGHMWISDENLYYYPRKEIVYFKGYLEVYRKNNFKSIGYTLKHITIISKIEYEKNGKSKRDYSTF